jgi:hypothetical protein
LWYYRSRYYDQNAGRFIREDPLRDLINEHNGYKYAANIPNDFTDPSGLAPSSYGPPPVPVPNGGPNNGWKWNPNPQDSRGGKWGPTIPIPGQSQPSGSFESDAPVPHWDIDDGKGSRQRYDESGKPISADEAHGKQPQQCPTASPNQKPDNNSPMVPFEPPTAPALPPGWWAPLIPIIVCLACRCCIPVPA